MTHSQENHRTERTRRYRAVALCSATLLAFQSRGGEAEAAPYEGSVDTPIATQAPRQQLNPTTRDIVLDVPLRERGPLGQVGIKITPNDTVLYSSQDFQNALSRVVTTEVRNALAAKAQPDGWLTEDAIRSLGFGIVYDPALVELQLELPTSLRQSQNLNLGFGSDEEPVVEPDQSAAFAAYLSYRASLDYVHEGVDTGLRAPRVDFDFNGRLFRRFAFENQFSYDDTLDDPFIRQASRVTFDQPERNLRWAGGDLSSNPVSFQGQESVAGLGVQRFYRGFTNGRTVGSTSSRSLTLERNATVEVYVNGSRVRTLQLGPGNYDVSDLPLTAGANTVQLVVQDELGGREVVNFDFFSDLLLLAPGVDEFDFKAGVRAPFENGARDYRGDQAIASGFYRRGISESLTVGGNFQVMEDIQQIGAEAVFGTRFGLFKTDLALSEAARGGSGYAARVEYRFTKIMPDLAGARRLDASFETRSRGFASVDVLDPINPFAYTALVRYSQPLAERWNGSVGADYSKGRDGQDDRYGASAFLAYDFSPNTNLTLSTTYQKGGIVDEVNARFEIIHRFGARSSASVSYETVDQRLRANFSRAPGRPIDDIAVSADIQATRDDAAFNGTVIYLGNRGDLELSHQTAFDQEDSEIVGQTTSLRASGSFAFADGRLAMGRRIYDSFVIVRPHESLEGRPVEIRGAFTQDAIARSGPLGPALVPLASYTQQAIPYDVKDAPIGYDLGLGNFDFYPWLNSGFSRVVGSQFNVTATGELLDRNGEPLALAYGMARSLDDKDAPEVQMFTNRVGRFGASGLAPGRWRLMMSNGLNYDLVIRGEDGNLLRTGALRPLNQETEQ